IHDFDEALTRGPTEARALLVSTAREYLERLQRDAGSRADLLHDIAQAYLKVGDVQRVLLDSREADAGGALESYETARALLADLLARGDADDAATLALRRDLAAAYDGLAQAHFQQGDLAAARADYERAI